jgi:carboxypeptidase Taq
VDVPNDKKGCLQDVHWSHGSFGYFPTYSLGSFYAAQFYQTAKASLQNWEAEMENGNSSPLLNWLRQNIHSKGRFFTSEELCREVTGTGLDVSYFVTYLLDKYVSIYNL